MPDKTPSGSGSDHIEDASAAAASSGSAAKSGGASNLSPRTWVAIGIGIFTLIFIFANWDPTTISFILFKAQMPLMIALLLSFVGGGVTGALIMHGRDKNKR